MSVYYYYYYYYYIGRGNGIKYRKRRNGDFCIEACVKALAVHRVGRPTHVDCIASLGCSLVPLAGVRVWRLILAGKPLSRLLVAWYGRRFMMWCFRRMDVDLLPVTDEFDALAVGVDRLRVGSAVKPRPAITLPSLSKPTSITCRSGRSTPRCRTRRAAKQRVSSSQTDSDDDDDDDDDGPWLFLILTTTRKHSANLNVRPRWKKFLLVSSSSA